MIPSLKSTNKKLMIVVICFFFQTTAFAQIQKGADINGEAAGDFSGYSVSMPDANTVAIGSPTNDGKAANAGHVRIYSWSDSVWLQKGADIDGEAGNNFSGISVSMPDANTVAIGAEGNGAGEGHVRIYSWSGSAWSQKGADIDGEAASDRSGYSVSMPDANTVAIGAPYNDGNATDAGHVRIYSWNGSAWSQKGADIDGEAASDQSGYKVSMPDANTVAIGALTNDGNGLTAGHVRIYSWNGSAWSQKGADIDGEDAYDASGSSVSMPDANTVAIGANSNDGNGLNAGHIRIYSWNGSAWIQKGADIDGEATQDASGWSVSMPDANTVAIGAHNNSGTAAQTGHVRIYSWSGSAWLQKSIDIDGEAADDQSGYSVSMPDANTVAIGATGNDAIASNAGHVRIYTLCKNTRETITRTACYSYISPSKKYTYTKSDTYYDTIPNVNGCDSIITINLTINQTRATIDEIACNSYVSPSKNYTYTKSDTYYDTIPNVNGCDSIITINLTINQTRATIAKIACYNYVSPSKKYTYTKSDTYYDTIPNANGCDSVITINLIINNQTTETIKKTACYSYVSPSKKYTYTKSDTYYDTIPNANGCDSVITINLTINSADVSVTNSSPTLTANATGATYQWLDCDNNFTEINNATNRSFLATSNGNYAVEVTQNGCIDTSLCINVSNANILENTFGNKLKVFPNPTKDVVTIELGYQYNEVVVIVRNALGQEVMKTSFNNTNAFKLNIPGVPGLYMLELHAPEHKALLRVLKN